MPGLVWAVLDIQINYGQHFNQDQTWYLSRQTFLLLQISINSVFLLPYTLSGAKAMRMSRWELVRKIKFYWITSPFISFTFQIPTFFNFILPALKKLVDCGLSIDYLPSCCHVKFLCANAAPQKKVECNVADCAQRRKVKLKTETKLVSSFKSFSDLIIFTKVCDEPRKGEVRFTENSGDSRDRLGSDTGMGWLGSPGKRRGGGKTTRNVHMKTRAFSAADWRPLCVMGTLGLIFTVKVSKQTDFFFGCCLA